MILGQIQLEMQNTYLENQDLRNQIESLLLVNKEQLSMISGVNSLLNDMKVQNQSEYFF